MADRELSLAVAGIQHPNVDGSSRRFEIELCDPGDAIHLLREPTNPHDPLAVAVVSVRGIQVGYLSRERAMWIGSEIDRGYDVRAIVERIKRFHLEGATLGLVMRLSITEPGVEGEPPELPMHPGVRRAA